MLWFNNTLSGFDARPAVRRSIVLGADRVDYDLYRDLLDNHAWDGRRPVIAEVRIAAGVRLTASTTATAAFRIPDAMPRGSRIVLLNQGEIAGKGGAGGANGTSGGAGGTGLAIEWPGPVQIDNAAGEINGGGGGGGGGGNKTGSEPTLDIKGNCSGCSSCTAVGGAGGGGYGPNGGSTGGAGSACGGGLCGKASCSPATGGSGGAGGGKGAAGFAGGSGGGAGGPGGDAVIGNAWITWIETGTRNGGIVP